MCCDFLCAGGMANLLKLNYVYTGHSYTVLDNTRSYNLKELLHLASQGDATAFKTLYEMHRDRVFYTALRMLQSRSQAQDALQEVFIKVWVNREKLMEIESFDAWILTIVRNLIYDKLREQSGRQLTLSPYLEEVMEAYSEQAFSETEFRELVALVEKAKQRLSPQQQKVFELSRLQGLKHKEIAAEMGISVETVKKYIMDALKSVQEFLKQHGKMVSVILLLQLMQA